MLSIHPIGVYSSSLNNCFSMLFFFVIFQKSKITDQILHKSCASLVEHLKGHRSLAQNSLDISESIRMGVTDSGRLGVTEQETEIYDNRQIYVQMNKRGSFETRRLSVPWAVTTYSDSHLQTFKTKPIINRQLTAPSTFQAQERHEIFEKLVRK